MSVYSRNPQAGGGTVAKAASNTREVNGQSYPQPPAAKPVPTIIPVKSGMDASKAASSNKAVSGNRAAKTSSHRGSLLNLGKGKKSSFNAEPIDAFEANRK